MKPEEKMYQRKILTYKYDNVFGYCHAAMVHDSTKDVSKNGKRCSQIWNYSKFIFST